MRIALLTVCTWLLLCMMAGVYPSVPYRRSIEHVPDIPVTGDHLPHVSYVVIDYYYGGRASYGNMGFMDVE